MSACTGELSSKVAAAAPIDDAEAPAAAAAYFAMDPLEGPDGSDSFASEAATSSLSPPTAPSPSTMVSTDLAGGPHKRRPRAAAVASAAVVASAAKAPLGGGGSGGKFE
jgi:hypothetical protein